MYGPGRGANIKLWLDVFQKQTEHKLFFLCTKFWFDKEKYSNIYIYEISSFKKVLFDLTFFLKIFLKSFDVLYIQGLYYNAFFLLYLYSIRKKIKCINIWNNRNYKKASKENKKWFERIIYKTILRKSDLIYINTQAVYNCFIKYFPDLENKCRVLPWGISSDFFSNIYKIESPKVKQILSKIPSKKKLIFFPREFSPINRQDLLIKAISVLKKKKEDFLDKLYFLFMSGLSCNSSYAKYLESLIDKYDLYNYISIFKETIPHREYASILERADLVVSLATKDQFSNAILEAMAKEKDVLLSFIYEYEKFVSDYGLEVIFTDNDKENIANQLVDYFKGKTEKINTEKNLEIIRNQLIFEKTFEMRMNYLSSLL